MSRREQLALLGAVALLCAMVAPLHNGFTDDGFIHIQYARNIADSGEYAFNPGEPSFGTTSPLWVMQLAALGKVFGTGEELVWISRALSWGAGILSLVLLFALCRRVAGRGAYAAAATIAFAANAWFVRWTALSMETSTAVFAVTGMCLASLDSTRDRARAARMGAWMALASLVRPEVYLAAPVWVLSAWMSRGAGRKRVGVGLVVCAALLLPWLLYARFHIGSFLPNTAGAKSGGLILEPLGIWARLSPIARIVGATQLISVAGAVASLLLLRGRSSLLHADNRFLGLWCLALPAAYVLFDIQVLSRYMLLVAPAVCVLGWVGISDVFRGRPGVAVVAAVLSVAVNIALYVVVVLPPSRAFSDDLQHNMKNLAVYIDQNAPPDAVVAAADIGYLAFYSNRRVLDLGGLVEPRTGVLREQYDYEDIVASARYFGIPGYPHVDYLVDREPVDARFDGQTLAGHRFERVYGTVVRNLGIRKPGPWYYTLYRIERAQP